MSFGIKYSVYREIQGSIWKALNWIARDHTARCLAVTTIPEMTEFCVHPPSGLQDA